MKKLQGDLGGWYVELSFVARVVTYVAILGIVIEIKFYLTLNMSVGRLRVF